MFKSIVAETLFEDLLNDMIKDLKDMLRSRTNSSKEIKETKSKLVNILVENEQKRDTEKFLRVVCIFYYFNNKFLNLKWLFFSNYREILFSKGWI